MESAKRFQSIFKINNVPILPPVIDASTKEEIKLIREQVRAKELKWQKLKEEKDRENVARQSARDENDSLRSRKLSFTLLSPTFASNLLPKISIETSESDKETVVDGPLSPKSVASEIDENAADKSSKDLKNEIDKRSLTPASSIYEPALVPQVNNQLKELIDKQKQEYLFAMEILKKKFNSEQHELLMNFQSNLLVTSTPLNTSIAPTTDDEDFTAFKTCLQSQSVSLDEKTVVNEEDLKLKSSTLINAYARGFLTRRLIKTIYVQEHVRNIRETLQLVLNLDDHHVGGSPVQNILLKAKLFRQLQNDLYNFNEIFFECSTKEQMRIIAADREVRLKKQAEENKENLNLSFKSVV